MTNEAMAPAFQRLADWKTKKGIPAVVRTIEWIEAARPFGGGSGGDGAEFHPGRVREVGSRVGGARRRYRRHSGALRAFSFSRQDSQVPTDMYYSCLDGSWNADGDSLWGEAYHSCSDPGDDADLYAEVYIGRMPASSLAEADLLVDKTIDY